MFFNAYFCQSPDACLLSTLCRCMFAHLFFQMRKFEKHIYHHIITVICVIFIYPTIPPIVFNFALGSELPFQFVSISTSLFGTYILYSHIRFSPLQAQIRAKNAPFLCTALIRPTTFDSRLGRPSMYSFVA